MLKFCYIFINVFVLIVYISFIDFSKIIFLKDLFKLILVILKFDWKIIFKIRNI